MAEKKEKKIYLVLNMDEQVNSMEEFEEAIEDEGIEVFTNKAKAMESFDTGYSHNYIFECDLSEAFKNRPVKRVEDLMKVDLK